MISVRNSHRRFTIPLALLALASLALLGGDGRAAPAAPPVNTAEPAISGRPEQGRTLTSSTGSWTGTLSPSRSRINGFAAARTADVRMEATARSSPLQPVAGTNSYAPTSTSECASG